MIEAWKDIKGFEGRYKVSNMGNVLTSGRGGWRMIKLKLHNGYCRVCLSEPFDGKKKKEKTRFVHRLVLEAFTGPAPEKHFAAHLNGIRTDNRIENLVWATRTENEAHKKLHGTYYNNKGLKRKGAVLTKEIADQIVDLRDNTNFSNNRIAELVGVNTTTVNALLGRRSFKDYWAQREGRKL